MIASLRLVCAALFAGSVASAQITVQIVLAQPLQLQAQVTGGPLQTATHPIGLDITNVGTLGVSSHVPPGLGGGTQLTVTPATTGPYGTTCELVASANYYTGGLGAVPFASSESGAELVSFQSPTPIAGVLLVETQFTPSAGYGTGTGTVQIDFGNDGSVELPLLGLLGPRFSQPCTLGPGQDFVVKVTHQGSLIGSQIGDYSTRATLRFLPHADGLVTYGPTNGCRPVAHVHFMSGGAVLAAASTNPPADFHVLALGHSQIASPMPIPSACPLLSSADLLLMPLSGAYLQLPHAAVASGSHVWLQFLGLRVANWTIEGSRGIHVFGQ